ncbi:unnamed protein product [Schistosoma margrebowiei]|uniref:Uncharacterized protein n=1 Tax=Schistosoma margrebowiei TaxID=48269 RepID=A0A183MVS4_9TREM|nr:unnamed protein product [Schistosoma margrebowiei]
MLDRTYFPRFVFQKHFKSVHMLFDIILDKNDQ